MKSIPYKFVLPAVKYEDLTTNDFGIGLMNVDDTKLSSAKMEKS